MQKIKGYVNNIITQKDKEEYILSSARVDLLEKGKYLVEIVREDYPRNGFFRKLFFQFKHRKEEYFWAVFFDSLNFPEKGRLFKICIGDLIDVKVERYYIKSDCFIAKEK